MKRLRIRVIFLASWLVFFYITSGLLDPVAISPITMGIVSAMVIVTLAVSNMPRGSLLAIMLIPITALMVTKYWVNALSGDLAILLAIVEIFAVALTLILARWVSSSLNEFEKSVTDITLGPHEKRLTAAPLEHGLIYREVRRARNHHRPLALISISIDQKSIDPDSERLAQEIQQSMMEQYKLKMLSKMLCAELEDCAVVAQDDDHYLAVLPETLPEDVQVVASRLRQKASDQIGVGLKIGVANLPRDGFTYEGLVERATQGMENDRGAQLYLIMDEQPVDSRIKD